MKKMEKMEMEMEMEILDGIDLVDLKPERKRERAREREEGRRK